MIETTLPQLLFAISMLFGRPFHLRSLDKLLRAINDTQQEFGVTGREDAELINGPSLDEETRQEVQLRRFRTQAMRAIRDTAFYKELLVRVGIDPSHLRHEDIQRIPITTKDALRDNPDAFVRRTARPSFRAMTTGTTGWPTSVYFSEYELQSSIRFAAIGRLSQGEIGPEDIALVSISSRAILGINAFMGACQRIGAVAFLGGLVEPELTLAMLAEERHIQGKKRLVSALLIYPSYLAQLITRGTRMGYQPSDFGLERIFVGGEVVTAGLKARCQELFGPVQFVEGYGMTEIWPFGGQLCSEGHLHFEPSQGLLEVVDPRTGAPSLPGELGTIVATPFPPYRETTIVLRYDTQDVVRALEGPLNCNLRNLPATSNVLGKLRLSVRHDQGWTFPRDVREALERIQEVDLPARFGFWAVPGGVAVEAVAGPNTEYLRRKIGTSLEELGVPLRELHLVEHETCLRNAFPLRCDLREASFTSSASVASVTPNKSAIGSEALQLQPESISTINKRSMIR